MAKRVKRKNTRRISRRVNRKNTLRKNTKINSKRKNTRRVNRKNTLKKNTLKKNFRRVNRKNTKLFGGADVQDAIPREMDEIDKEIAELKENAFAYAVQDPPDEWYAHFLFSKAKALAEETPEKYYMAGQIDGDIENVNESYVTPGSSARLLLPPASQDEHDINLKERFDRVRQYLNVGNNLDAQHELKAAMGYAVSNNKDFTARYIDNIISDYGLVI